MTDLPRPLPEMDQRIVDCALDGLDKARKQFAPLLEKGQLTDERMVMYVVSYLGAQGWIRKRRKTDIDIPTEEEIEEIRERGATA